MNLTGNICFAFAKTKAHLLRQVQRGTADHYFLHMVSPIPTAPVIGAKARVRYKQTSAALAMESGHGDGMRVSAA
jgi:hypothetical protein